MKIAVSSTINKSSPTHIDRYNTYIKPSTTPSSNYTSPSASSSSLPNHGHYDNSNIPIDSTTPLQSFNNTSHTTKWNHPSSHRLFFDRFASKAKIITEKDWHQYRVNDIYNKGGKGVLNGYYRGSLFSALEVVYPETNWKCWQFGSVSNSYWNDLRTIANSSTMWLQDTTSKYLNSGCSGLNRISFEKEGVDC